MRRESKDHATLSDLYLNNVISRLTHISEDSARLLKRVSACVCVCHMTPSQAAIGLLPSLMVLVRFCPPCCFQTVPGCTEKEIKVLQFPTAARGGGGGSLMREKPRLGRITARCCANGEDAVLVPLRRGKSRRRRRRLRKSGSADFIRVRF